MFFFSVLMARAIRRIDPESSKPIIIGVAIDGKSIVGNTDNYRAFPDFAFLDFSKESEKDAVADILRPTREKLKAQACTEKILCFVKKQKVACELMKPLPLQTKIDLTQKAFIERAASVSAVVSYVKTKTFGPLDPYIKELYGIAEPSHEDAVCELKCINNSFFLTFIQTFAYEMLFNAFLKEMDSIGIPYEIKWKEPCKPSGVRFDGLEGIRI